MNLVDVFVLIITLVFPFVATKLAERYSFLEKLGPIVICYIFGFLLGNSGMPFNADILKSTADVVVPLSIPLFIFGVDFIGWFKNGRSTVISFGLVIFSVCFMTILAGLIFHPFVLSAPEISGMLAGVYTGGTPNLSAIGKALQVKEETILLVNGVDMAVGSLYLAILLYFGRNFLCRFLQVCPVDKAEEFGHQSEQHDLKKLAKGAGLGTLLSILIFGLSFGLSLLIFGQLNVAFFIFFISFFAGLVSFSPKIRSLNGPYEFGHYLLMIFCVAIGGLANIKQLMSLSMNVALMCSMVVFGVVLLHFMLAKLFKIDRDTAVITSVAGIYGPPFVPLIADQFGNKKMIAPGIATGLVGFAVGNYLGLGIYFLLRYLIGQ